MVSCNYSLQYNVEHRATIYCNILIGIVQLFIAIYWLAPCNYLLQYIDWHRATIYCGVLYGIVQLFIVSYYMTLCNYLLYCMALCNNSLQYTVWHRATIHCSILYGTVRLFIAVYCMALHRPDLCWTHVSRTARAQSGCSQRRCTSRQCISPRNSRRPLRCLALGPRDWQTNNSLYNNNGSGTDRQQSV